MSQENPHSHQPPFKVPSVDEMGALLPQFAFEKLAAFGGMGAVFKARQESLDRPVAIKILPPEFGAETEFAERFKSEARAMAKLNHTNIVAVYDFGITKEGHLYLVMEWVEGHTLHELIHKGKLPLRKAANLAMQLCDALAFAHNHKILHRDIKPGNIMVNHEDQVKVADFGLARPITGEAEENPYGTPDYAAPEILGKRSVDQRADIYSAGIVLYEMLTGRVPKNPRVSVTEYLPVSPRWDELIDTSTHPDPAKRFADARDMRAQISNLLSRAEEVVPVAVVEEPKPVTRRGGLQPMHLAMIGAAVMIVLGWMLGSMFHSEPEPEPRNETKAEPKMAEQQPEVTPKPEEQPEKKSEPVVAMQTPGTQKPEPKAESKPEPKLEPSTPAMTAAAPAPPTAPTPPPPADPRALLLRLEEVDPEMSQLVSAFGDEWSANDAIETDTEVQDLAGKYIPALQRALAGLMPEQRDHILSEISHIANREPLNAPEPSWPPVLASLRKTYDTQIETIRTASIAAAEKMRAAQCELVQAKAKERAAAGKTDAAKLAESLAAELSRLKGKPSLKALKESAAIADAPPAPPAVP
ncbi:MAG: protein kinase [Verrucomicrobiaceae bacterium]